mmetsp:Transcript_25312/g.58641  ORF Transcript_25312/g.58641 Transcript_25312/m.58641 type:complete len:200 (-) Transcript_25312:795-1394(-)
MQRRKIASSGCTLITSSLGDTPRPSKRLPEVGLNCTLMSTSFSSSALPQERMNGTPDHLALLMYSAAMAYVGVMLPSGTVLSSRYPSWPFAAMYWPTTTSCILMGSMHRRASTLRFLMSSALREMGVSMATRASSCSRWFCMTSRIMPYSSKYPPLPCVPMSSLNVMCTQLTWLRFQSGSKTRFAKRIVMMLCAISFPR